MRKHHIPIGMAKIQNTHITKRWRECGTAGTLIHFWWKGKMVQLLWKTVWQVLKKLSIELPYKPTVPPLGIQPRELKTYVHTKFCIQMFRKDVFIKSQNNTNPNVHQPDNG